MIDQALEEEYLVWLYSQVGSVKNRNPARAYWSLLRQLHHKEFVWVVPNDDNRVADGRELRYRFLDEVHGINKRDVDPEWIGQGCSMLEMLIGLSRRLSFEAEGEPLAWFWHLIENLGLQGYNDAYIRESHDERIDKILNRVIWRHYDMDGHGGLFPLRRPERDQRRVEIWYQMSAYILERI